MDSSRQTANSDNTGKVPIIKVFGDSSQGSSGKDILRASDKATPQQTHFTSHLRPEMFVPKRGKRPLDTLSSHLDDSNNEQGTFGPLSESEPSFTPGTEATGNQQKETALPPPELGHRHSLTSIRTVMSLSPDRQRNQDNQKDLYEPKEEAIPGARSEDFVDFQDYLFHPPIRDKGRDSTNIGKQPASIRTHTDSLPSTRTSTDQALGKLVRSRYNGKHKTQKEKGNDSGYDTDTQTDTQTDTMNSRHKNALESPFREDTDYDSGYGSDEEKKAIDNSRVHRLLSSIDTYVFELLELGYSIDQKAGNDMKWFKTRAQGLDKKSGEDAMKEMDWDGDKARLLNRVHREFRNDILSRMKFVSKYPAFHKAELAIREGRLHEAKSMLENLVEQLNRREIAYNFYPGRPAADEQANTVTRDGKLEIIEMDVQGNRLPRRLLSFDTIDSITDGSIIVNDKSYQVHTYKGYKADPLREKHAARHANGKDLNSAEYKEGGDKYDKAQKEAENAMHNLFFAEKSFTLMQPYQSIDNDKSLDEHFSQKREDLKILWAMAHRIDEGAENNSGLKKIITDARTKIEKLSTISAEISSAVNKLDLKDENFNTAREDAIKKIKEKYTKENSTDYIERYFDILFKEDAIRDNKRIKESGEKQLLLDSKKEDVAHLLGGDIQSLSEKITHLTTDAKKSIEAFSDLREGERANTTWAATKARVIQEIARIAEQELRMADKRVVKAKSKLQQEDYTLYEESYEDKTLENLKACISMQKERLRHYNWWNEESNQAWKALTQIKKQTSSDTKLGDVKEQYLEHYLIYGVRRNGKVAIYPLKQEEGDPAYRGVEFPMGRIDFRKTGTNQAGQFVIHFTDGDGTEASALTIPMIDDLDPALRHMATDMLDMNVQGMKMQIEGVLKILRAGDSEVDEGNLHLAMATILQKDEFIKQSFSLLSRPSAPQTETTRLQQIFDSYSRMARLPDTIYKEYNKNNSGAESLNHLREEYLHFKTEQAKTAIDQETVGTTVKAMTGIARLAHPLRENNPHFSLSDYDFYAHAGRLLESVKFDLQPATQRKYLSEKLKLSTPEMRRTIMLRSILNAYKEHQDQPERIQDAICKTLDLYGINKDTARQLSSAIRTSISNFEQTAEISRANPIDHTSAAHAGAEASQQTLERYGLSADTTYVNIADILHSSPPNLDEVVQGAQEAARMERNILMTRISPEQTLGDILEQHLWSEAALHYHAQKIMDIVNVQKKETLRSLRSHLMAASSHPTAAESNSQYLKVIRYNTSLCPRFIHMDDKSLMNMFNETRAEVSASSRAMLEGPIPAAVSGIETTTKNSVRAFLQSKGLADEAINTMTHTAERAYFSHSAPVTQENKHQLMHKLAEAFRDKKISIHISAALASAYREKLAQLEASWTRAETIDEHVLDYKQAKEMAEYLYGQEGRKAPETTLMVHLKTTLRDSTDEVRAKIMQQSVLNAYFRHTDSKKRQQAVGDTLQQYDLPPSRAQQIASALQEEMDAKFNSWLSRTISPQPGQSLTITEYLKRVSPSTSHEMMNRAAAAYFQHASDPRQREQAMYAAFRIENTREYIGHHLISEMIAEFGQQRPSVLDQFKNHQWTDKTYQGKALEIVRDATKMQRMGSIQDVFLPSVINCYLKSMSVSHNERVERITNTIHSFSSLDYTLCRVKAEKVSLFLEKFFEGSSRVKAEKVSLFLEKFFEGSIGSSDTHSISELNSDTHSISELNSDTHSISEESTSSHSASEASMTLKDFFSSHDISATALAHMLQQANKALIQASDDLIEHINSAFSHDEIHPTEQKQLAKFFRDAASYDKNGIWDIGHAKYINIYQYDKNMANPYKNQQIDFSSGLSLKRVSADPVNPIQHMTSYLHEKLGNQFNHYYQLNSMWENKVALEKIYNSMLHPNRLTTRTIHSWSKYLKTIEEEAADNFSNPQEQEAVRGAIRFQNQWVQNLQAATARWIERHSEVEWENMQTVVNHTRHQILRLDHSDRMILDTLEKDQQQTPEQMKKAIGKISQDREIPLKTWKDIRDEQMESFFEKADVFHKRMQKIYADDSIESAPLVEWVADVAAFAQEAAPYIIRDELMRRYLKYNHEDFKVFASRAHRRREHYTDFFEKMLTKELERRQDLQKIRFKENIQYHNLVNRMRIEQEDRVKMEMLKQRHTIERQRLMSSMLNKQYFFTTLTFMMLGANQGAMVAGDGVTRASVNIMKDLGPKGN